MPMTAPIYLDYAATTPVDERVVAVMQRYLTVDQLFANPASRSHMGGWQAEQAIEHARRQVADAIQADPREIVWTSGATEANNLALTGYMRANQTRGRHLITSTIEHKAVIDTVHALEDEGVEVSWLRPGKDGRIDPQQLADALREDTALVSLMTVNNEIGSINDIEGLVRVAHAHGAAFHTDAAQAIGRVALDVSRAGVDLMSLSAHKAYGPKGVGALYVRRHPDMRIAPLIHGGGHERGMRSGTLPTHQISAMGEAFAIAIDEADAEQARIEALRQRFLDGLGALEGLYLNSPPTEGVPNIVNLAFDGIDAEPLLLALRDLAVSTGSACNSASMTPSHVLTGIGIPRSLALSSLRFSFGRFTSEDDLTRATHIITHAVTGLRLPV